MSVVLKQVIENIEEITSGEKALVVHCLISSLEVKASYTWYQYQAKGLGEDYLTELETSYQAIIELPNTWSKFKKEFRRFVLSKFRLVFRVHKQGKPERVLVTQ